jgi:ABC-type multidrug transport system fused ATPase/permease subunit
LNWDANWYDIYFKFLLLTNNKYSCGYPWRLENLQAWYTGLFVALIGFIGTGAMVLVLWYGATLVLAGTLTAGTLLSFVLYTITVGASLAGAAGLFADLMKASGANQRVFELIDRVPRVPPAFCPTPMEAEARDWARVWEDHEVH